MAKPLNISPLYLKALRLLENIESIGDDADGKEGCTTRSQLVELYLEIKEECGIKTEISRMVDLFYALAWATETPYRNTEHISEDLLRELPNE